MSNGGCNFVFNILPIILPHVGSFESWAKSQIFSSFSWGIFSHDTLRSIACVLNWIVSSMSLFTLNAISAQQYVFMIIHLVDAIPGIPANLWESRQYCCLYLLLQMNQCVCLCKPSLVYLVKVKSQTWGTVLLYKVVLYNLHLWLHLHQVIWWTFQASFRLMKLILKLYLKLNKTSVVLASLFTAHGGLPY